MVYQEIFTEDYIKSLYDRVIAFSVPPITINKGGKSESLYYPNKPMHDWTTETHSFEEIIFFICDGNPGLCNAVYDYAHREEI